MATDTFNIPLKQKLGIMRKVEFYGLDWQDFAATK